MNEVATVALKCLIMILTTAITCVVIPYIKNKIGDDRWEKLQQYTEIAVRYAEQTFLENEDKKEYVYHYILVKANELGLGLDEQDIDVLVEGVVNAVKRG